MSNHNNSKWRTVDPRAQLGYEPGGILSARDLSDEQYYRRQRVRRHNRFMHDWGVVCGVRVAAEGDPTRPWSVWVCPGVALDPCGEEIVVHCRTRIDLRDYLWNRPHDGVEFARKAYVAIRFAQTGARTTPLPNLRCGCGEPAYGSSRIQDCFEVNILWEVPTATTVDTSEFCGEGSPDCAQSPADPHVLLACITLPHSEGDIIVEANIDNSLRRHTLPVQVRQTAVRGSKI